MLYNIYVKSFLFFFIRCDSLTTHKIICSNSDNLSMIADKSIHLIVTSPPYPMISMWDEVFINM
jgi:DNA modification methylase